MENAQETFKGTIMFLPDNVGSKSEAVYPFIYVSRDVYFKVLLKDDNPFENKGLMPFDGKLVEIVGAMGRRTFIVETVRAVEPETEPMGEGAENVSDKGFPSSSGDGSNENLIK